MSKNRDMKNKGEFDFYGGFPRTHSNDPHWVEGWDRANEVSGSIEEGNKALALEEKLGISLSEFKFLVDYVSRRQ